MILLTVAMQSSAVLADIDTNFSPKAPVGSNGIIEIVRYISWGVLILGIVAIMAAGGLFGWEKLNGGVNNSPKMVAGALIGGILATVAGTLMNAVTSAAAS